jgi:hypothetical protein
MKNKLTLKSLQEQLEAMKATTKSTKSVKPAVTEKVTKGGSFGGHDIKNSYINSLYMRSSGLMMYLVTGVLAYATKIPILRNLISVLALYYGKTTIWKFLSTMRKLFIVLNAIIGVYMVFKTAGFSTDNLLIGWTAIGETYLQTLGSLVGKLFRWFVELFDHKIVPNVPGDNGGTWFSRPQTPSNKSIFTSSNLNIPNLIDNDAFSLRKLYKDSIPSSTSWYKDYTTWLWIIGGVTFVYFGYKFLSDPLNILNVGEYFKGKPTIKTFPPVDPTGSDITLGNDPSTLYNYFTTATKGVLNLYNKTISGLNPFNYFVSASQLETQFNQFMQVQNDYIRADRALYPFTEVNPFDSWFKRLRLHYYGETISEWTQRTEAKLGADYVYNSLSVSKGKAIDVSGGTPLFSAHTTPAVTPATVLGLHPSTSSLVDAVNTATVSNTLSKIPTVPSVNPDWSSHIVDRTDEAFNKFSKLNLWGKPETKSSSSGIFNFVKTHQVEDLFADLDDTLFQ